MKAKNIFVNGISLESLLQEHNNIMILIRHAKNTKDNGGLKALLDWDAERTKPIEYDIQLDMK